MGTAQCDSSFCRVELQRRGERTGLSRSVKYRRLEILVSRDKIDEIAVFGRFALRRFLLCARCFHMACEGHTATGERRWEILARGFAICTAQKHRVS